ncbi:MAG: nicotinate-nucleotide--dimethylbenzimidazole phosphoribosyltransferase [Dehalococcoidales bacterium]|nr:nicotinate-nucleotide--dimethylbenzimidazole phosphoribosyltransferase [Dehalococcoidales bacterium]
MTESLSEIIEKIGAPDKTAMAEAKARQNSLTKPAGSLGRLEDLSVQLAGIQGRLLPRIKEKAIIVMAADHGVVAEGVSAYPQEVTPQMVYNFLDGGAGVNVIARQMGVRLVIVDIGIAATLKSAPRLLSRKIARGTRNMTAGPAMSDDEAKRAIETGIEVVRAELSKGLDIIGTGDMGIGNTTSSSAICAVMTGRPISEVTGRGTGITDKQLEHKIAVITRAIRANEPDPAKPIELLAKVGGLEIGGITGVILAAAAHRIPVVIDGFISGAAALIAAALAPAVKDFLIAAHVSAEPGHRLLLKHLGLRPLLDLGMRLGEGTGAALGISLAETSVRILAEMSTFADAGVSGRSEVEN